MRLLIVRSFDLSIPMRLRYSFLAITCLWTGLPHMASAQSAVDPSRQTEAITVRPAVTPLRSDVALDSGGGTEFDSFAPLSSGDDDIGEQLILRQKEKVQRFSVAADSLVMWTDNAAHASAGEIDDAFWGWRVAADWQPVISGGLMAPVGISQSWYRYDEIDALDFETLDVNAGLAYLAPELGNVMFFAQYQFERVTQYSDELMNSHSVRAGAQHLLLLNRRNSIQSAVYADVDIDNDVDALKRNEYIASVAWRFKLTRKVETVLGYRYTCFDYAEIDRLDHLHLIDLSLIYTPFKWLQVYASAAYGFNQSSLDVYDYEAGTLGGGLGLRIRF